MSVCAFGPVFRSLQLAPLSRASEFGVPATNSNSARHAEPHRLMSQPERQVAFAQSDRHHLFITIDGHASTNRQLRIHLIDGDGLAERFAGDVEGSVFSLASAGGAMMIGLLSEREISGSLVFPDGRAHRFSAEFAPVA